MVEKMKLPGERNAQLGTDMRVKFPKERSSKGGKYCAMWTHEGDLT